MATFPTSMMKVGPVAIDDGSRSSRASDGSYKTQRLHGSNMHYTFNVEFPHITRTDFQSLLNFYSTNKSDSNIEFTDPESGVTYLVRMMGPPQIESRTNMWYTVTMELVGTEA